jgi:multidrug efflux pump subunit AcrA (membrane-fusion protein)
VLALAGVLLEPLAEEVLAILVHVCRVPEKVAFLVDLVEDLETLLVRLWLAVESALDDVLSAAGGGNVNRELLEDIPNPLYHIPVW